MAVLAWVVPAVCVGCVLYYMYVLCTYMYMSMYDWTVPYFVTVTGEQYPVPSKVCTVDYIHVQLYM